MAFDRTNTVINWERIDGWNKYLRAAPTPTAKRFFQALLTAWPTIHDRAVNACGLEPGCDEIAHEIVDWTYEWAARNSRGYIRAKAVQGYFDGVEDWYHWWAQIKIGRRCYIVDGTRNQFYPATHTDPVLIVLECESNRARTEYQLAPSDET